MPDYGTLKLVWWGLIALLLIGFAVMDGHDLGVGGLLTLLGRNDEERRVLLNTVGPHWDGNQVWFITAGGALFAAWPMVYAAAFSLLYPAMLAVLWTFFLRPVGFDYRSKWQDPRWRRAWDGVIVLSGALPPVLFGVAVGHVMLGLPFRYSDELVLQPGAAGVDLSAPFPLLCGVLASAMTTLQGAVYLCHRTEGVLRARALRAAGVAALAMVAAFALAGAWLRWGGLAGHVLSSPVDPNGLPDVLAKSVRRDPAAWWTTLRAHPEIGRAHVLNSSHSQQSRMPSSA